MRAGGGLRIHYFRDLANAGTRDLRTVRMDGDVPYERAEHCPACEEQLQTLATLIDGSGKQRIRMGCCGSCGYVGYMDRPSREWIAHFYTEEWDAAKKSGYRALDAVASKAAGKGRGLSPEQEDALRLAADADLPVDALICDIGCGTGSVLEAFASRGFRRLCGVEHSRWRAEAAGARYGAPVYVGGFADPSIQRSLRGQAPFGILFSFHVLEHVVDPAAFLRSAAGLQDDQGVLVLALPEALREPAVSTVFWLPHLHSFTRVSLERLLNRAGYEIDADNFSHGGLMVRARRARSQAPRYRAEADYLPRAAEFLERALFMDALASGKRYKLWWTSKSFRTGIGPAPSSELLDRAARIFSRGAQFLGSRLLGRFDNRRSFVASALERRLTRPQASPIEIQFDGAIELLVR